MFKVKSVNFIRKLLLVTTAVLLGACATPQPNVPDGKQVYVKNVRENTASFVGRDYLLSPGDELEVVYQFDVKLEPEYRLAIGDQIRVELSDYPQMDRTLDVRPDGRVTLPYIGDIDAVGLTPTELAGKVDRVYTQLLVRPRSTVSLVRYGQRIRDLKDAIRNAARGQSRLTVIGPDGRVTLPLLEPIMAAGKTIEQLQRDIDTSYKRIINGMNSSTLLLKATGNRIYVFGYVQAPNYYELVGPTTVTQAVAMAKGLMPEAQVRTVLLITRDDGNIPVGRVLNLAEIMQSGNLGEDVILRQGDVIYVPNTRLADAALTARQLWDLIPRPFTYGYSINVAR